MSEEDVLLEIDMGETAYSLLLREIPGCDKRFNRLAKQMDAFIKAVKIRFPDACYYTGSGGFNLLLGASHDERCNPRQQLVALSATDLFIGDGDW